MGRISQNAALPAFRHARRDSTLAALVSPSAPKRRALAAQYRVPAFSYDDYDDCLRAVDAVYIALPNSMHAEYTDRAAQAGGHVLCEKPMAVTSADCERMIRTCRKAGVKLMVAYRLYFEAQNSE